MKNLSRSKEKKNKSNNMAMNNAKICQKMKIKSWLSIEEEIIEGEKRLYYNYKKLFSFRKIFFLGVKLIKWAR